MLYWRRWTGLGRGFGDDGGEKRYLSGQVSTVTLWYKYSTLYAYRVVGSNELRVCFHIEVDKYASGGLRTAR